VAGDEHHIATAHRPGADSLVFLRAEHWGSRGLIIHALIARIGGLEEAGTGGRF